VTALRRRVLVGFLISSRSLTLSTQWPYIPAVVNNMAFAHDRATLVVTI
jgi:hypothetical protein